MDAIFRFVVDNEILIYLVLALGGVVAVRWLIKALREYRQAVFGLEREFARRRLASSLTTVSIILVVTIIEFLVVSFVIPSLESSTFTPTPTLALSSAGTLAGNTLAGETATAPEPAPASAEGCVANQVAFTSPEPGQEVSDVVVLTGVINVPSFGFYKYEVAAAGTENWNTISAGRTVGEDGQLGRWDTTELVPGDYLLRLVVTDNEGNALPPCVVSVRVVGE